jgi:hypothetical protein
MRDVMLIVHFIGLTMSLGTGFANLFLGMAATKLEPAERGKFMSNALILMRMGHTGLGFGMLNLFVGITIVVLAVLSFH